jgi:hypothetical protein
MIFIFSYRFLNYYMFILNMPSNSKSQADFRKNLYVYLIGLVLLGSILLFRGETYIQENEETQNNIEIESTQLESLEIDDWECKCPHCLHGHYEFDPQFSIKNGTQTNDYEFKSEKGKLEINNSIELEHKLDNFTLKYDYESSEFEKYSSIYDYVLEPNQNEFPDCHIYSIDFSPTDNYLAIGSYGEDAYIYNTKYFTLEKTFQYVYNAETKVRFSPNGNYLAIGDEYNGQVQVFETGNWNQIASYSRNTNDIAFTPDNNWFAISNPNGVYIYNTSTWALDRTIGNNLNCEITSIAFSDNKSNYISIGTRNNTYDFHYEYKNYILNMTSGDTIETLSDPNGFISTMDISTDLLAIGSYDDNVYVYNTTTWELNKVIYTINSVSSLEFSPDGEWLSVANRYEQNINIYYTKNWRLGETLVGSPNDYKYIDEISFKKNEGEISLASGGRSKEVWAYEFNPNVKTINAPIDLELFNYSSSSWDKIDFTNQTNGLQEFDFGENYISSEFKVQVKFKGVSDEFFRFYINSLYIVVDHYIEIGEGKRWEDYAIEDWMKGEGTKENPYVLENMDFISDENSSFALKIVNSEEYFEIKNCSFKNAGLGISLINTTNGKIYNNEFSNLNGEDGASGEDGRDHDLISGDEGEAGEDGNRGKDSIGISLDLCQNITISNNIFSNIQAGKGGDGGKGGDSSSQSLTFGGDGGDGGKGGNAIGIYLESSKDITPKQNIFLNLDGGKGGRGGNGGYGYYKGGTGGKGAWGGDGIGISLDSSETNIIQTNNISSNGGNGGRAGDGGYGYYFDGDDGLNGGWGGDGIGISLDSSETNIIQTNNFSKIYGGDGDDGANGGVGGNAIGIYTISSSIGNVIKSSTFFDLKGGDKGYSISYSSHYDGRDGYEYSVSIRNPSYDNTFYLNNFSYECKDLDTNNMWDNGTIGNIWDGIKDLNGIKYYPLYDFDGNKGKGAPYSYKRGNIVDRFPISPDYTYINYVNYSNYGNHISGEIKDMKRKDNKTYVIEDKSYGAFSGFFDVMFDFQFGENYSNFEALNSSEFYDISVYFSANDSMVKPYGSEGIWLEGKTENGWKKITEIEGGGKTESIFHRGNYTKLRIYGETDRGIGNNRLEIDLLAVRLHNRPIHSSSDIGNKGIRMRDLTLNISEVIMPNESFSIKCNVSPSDFESEREGVVKTIFYNESWSSEWFNMEFKGNTLWEKEFKEGYPFPLENASYNVVAVATTNDSYASFDFTQIEVEIYTPRIKFVNPSRGEIIRQYDNYTVKANVSIPKSTIENVSLSVYQSKDEPYLDNIAMEKISEKEWVFETNFFDLNNIWTFEISATCNYSFTTTKSSDILIDHHPPNSEVVSPNPEETISPNITFQVENSELSYEDYMIPFQTNLSAVEGDGGINSAKWFVGNTSSINIRHKATYDFKGETDKTEEEISFVDVYEGDGVCEIIPSLGGHYDILETDRRTNIAHEMNHTQENIEFFFRTDNMGGAGEYNTFFDIVDNQIDSWFPFVTLTVIGNNGEIRAISESAESMEEATMLITDDLEKDEWYHMRLLPDFTELTIDVYIDEDFKAEIPIFHPDATGMDSFNLIDLDMPDLDKFEQKVWFNSFGFDSDPNYTLGDNLYYTLEEGKEYNWNDLSLNNSNGLWEGQFNLLDYYYGEHYIVFNATDEKWNSSITFERFSFELYPIYEINNSDVQYNKDGFSIEEDDLVGEFTLPYHKKIQQNYFTTIIPQRYGDAYNYRIKRGDSYITPLEFAGREIEWELSEFQDEDIIQFNLENPIFDIDYNNSGEFVQFFSLSSKHELTNAEFSHTWYGGWDDASYYNFTLYYQSGDEWMTMPQDDYYFSRIFGDSVSFTLFIDINANETISFKIQAEEITEPPKKEKDYGFPIIMGLLIGMGGAVVWALSSHYGFKKSLKKKWGNTKWIASIILIGLSIGIGTFSIVAFI